MRIEIATVSTRKQIDFQNELLPETLDTESQSNNIAVLNYHMEALNLALTKSS